jgi:hypothetical protein
MIVLISNCIGLKNGKGAEQQEAFQGIPGCHERNEGPIPAA